ncbi:MAG TPA: hypothetical protein VJ044_03220, partial [Candidatus Hodarchaeales archaeon]|nr:hypothetical protein [Candidatus Hodarchaeales archaeon]
MTVEWSKEVYYEPHPSFIIVIMLEYISALIVLLSGFAVLIAGLAGLGITEPATDNLLYLFTIFLSDFTLNILLIVPGIVVLIFAAVYLRLVRRLQGFNRPARNTIQAIIVGKILLSALMLWLIPFILSFAELFILSRSAQAERRSN